MPLSDLSKEEVKIIGDCIKAVAYGPFIEESEIEKFLCVTLEEAREVSDRFPDVDEFDDGAEGLDDSYLVINNSLAFLLNYPHGKDEIWDDCIPVSREVVKKVFEKWRH